MIALLDVNVVIALIDPGHIHHKAANRWFEGHEAGWATCPLVENGVARIVGRARYPNSPGPPSVVLEMLLILRRQPGYAFWPDDVSLLDPRWFDLAQFVSHARLTDSYLLGLAASKGGHLASFDRKLDARAVRDGRRHLLLIPPA